MTFSVNTNDAGDLDEVTPAVAASANGTIFAAWRQDTTNSSINNTLAVRVFDSSGTALTAEFIPNSTGSDNIRSPQVAAINDTTFVVLYYDADTNSSTANEIRAEIFFYNPLNGSVSSGGSRVISDPAVDASTGIMSIAVLDSGHIAFAYERDISTTNTENAVFLTITDLSLNITQASTRINTINDAADDVNLMASGSTLIATWEQDVSSGIQDVQGRIFTLNGNGRIASQTAPATLREEDNSGNGLAITLQEAVQLANGDVLIVTTGGPDSTSTVTDADRVYATIWNSSLSTVQQADFEVTTNAVSASPRAIGAVAFAGGGFLVFWSQQIDVGSGVANSDNFEVFYRIYDNTYTATGAPVRLTSTANSTDDDDVDVARLSEDGDVVLIWQRDPGTGEANINLVGEILADLDPNPLTTTNLNATNVDDVLTGDGNDNTATFTAGTVNPGDTYDGSGGTDTAAISGGGTIDFSGVTLTSVEQITTDTADTNLTVTEDQARLITSMGGTADNVTMTNYSWWGDLSITANRTDATGLLTQLLNNGAETVSWSEGSGTITARLDNGLLVLAATDTGGANWTTSVMRLDALGNRTSKVTNFDDGSQETTTFSNDGLATVQRTGIPGAEDSTTLSFNSVGQLITKTTVFDDGSTQQTTFDGAGRTDSFTKIESDGFSVTRTFNDSNIVTSVTYDDTNSLRESWTTATQIFDGGTPNLLTQRIVVQDDGNTYTEVYSFGVLQGTLLADTNGDEPFSQIGLAFAGPGGAFSQRTVVADSGEATTQGTANGEVILLDTAFDETARGLAGADTFQFIAATDPTDQTIGHDVIRDFEQGQDLLDLRLLGITNVATLNAQSQTVSTTGTGDTVITFDAQNSLTLSGVSGLTDADFVFVPVAPAIEFL